MQAAAPLGCAAPFHPKINSARTRAVTKRSSARLHSCGKVPDAPLTYCGSLSV
jgi:hypothetical protein